MKRFLAKSFFILVLLVFALSFVSAGFFGDFWNKFTGKMIDAPSEFSESKNFAGDYLDEEVPFRVSDTSEGNSLTKLFSSFFGLFQNEEKIEEKSSNQFDNPSFLNVNFEEVKQKALNLNEETFIGKLLVLHYDLFEDGKTEEYFFLRTDKGNYLILSEDSFYPSDSGFELEIRGKLVGDNIFMEKVDEKTYKILSETGQESVLSLKYAYILAKHSSITSEPFSKADATNLLFETIDQFYVENSYGKFNLPGDISDVYGWYDLDYGGSCVPGNSIISEADSDVYYPDYEGVIVYWERNASLPPCPYYAGSTSLNTESISTQDGLVELYVIKTLLNNPYVIAHEIGHNLKVKHANFLFCGNKTLSYPVEGVCQSWEYWDRFSVMGNNFHHFNSVHKEKLNWFEADEIKLVNQSGTFTLYPIESSGSFTKLIKISNEYPFPYLPVDYYLEFRQPIGFDSNLPNEAIGVLLHFRRAVGSFSTWDSHLLDPFPPVTNARTSIKMGETYYDYYSGISIKYLPSIPTSNISIKYLPSIPTSNNTPDDPVDFANIKISFFEPPCVRANPEVISENYTGPFMPTPLPYVYSYFNVKSSITNNDEYCLPRNFSLSLSSPWEIHNNFHSFFYPEQSWYSGFDVRILNSNFSLGNYTFYLNYSDNQNYSISKPISWNFTHFACWDGTPFGECSINKPQYCEEGNLINKCDLCGCPPRRVCGTNGACAFPQANPIYAD